MAKSSVSRPQIKPKKPYPEFPLSIHQSGRWFKKFKGKFHYFGPLDDWQSALEKYEREWPHIIQGKTVPPVGSENGATVADVCNSFLNMKRPLIASAELSHRSFEDYFVICEKVVATFGKDRSASDLRPEDFGRLRSVFSSIHGPHRLTKDITVTKMVFRHSHEVRLLDSPVLYGGSFDKPSRKVIRRARNAAGSKMFEAIEIRLVLKAADPIMRSMVLLGINCGFGNTDISTLPQSAVDFDGGWIDFPRAKTEINRRVPLWPETIEALRIAIAKRPKPADKTDAGLCFLTTDGRRWVRTQPKKNSDRMTAFDALGQKFRKLLDSLDVKGRRNFYGLRHSFQTVAEESRDLSAVKHVMGHSDDFNMSGRYREKISDERLQAVTDTVRAWLWPKHERRWLMTKSIIHNPLLEVLRSLLDHHVQREKADQASLPQTDDAYWELDKQARKEFLAKQSQIDWVTTPWQDACSYLFQAFSIEATEDDLRVCIAGWRTNRDEKPAIVSELVRLDKEGFTDKLLRVLKDEFPDEYIDLNLPVPSDVEPDKTEEPFNVVIGKGQERYSLESNGLACFSISKEWEMIFRLLIGPIASGVKSEWTPHSLLNEAVGAGDPKFESIASPLLKNTIKNVNSELRSWVEPPGEVRWIEGRRGVGYRLNQNIHWTIPPDLERDLRRTTQSVSTVPTNPQTMGKNTPSSECPLPAMSRIHKPRPSDETTEDDD